MSPRRPPGCASAQPRAGAVDAPSAREGGEAGSIPTGYNCCESSGGGWPDGSGLVRWAALVGRPARVRRRPGILFFAVCGSTRPAVLQSPGPTAGARPAWPSSPTPACSVRSQPSCLRPGAPRGGAGAGPRHAGGRQPPSCRNGARVTQLQAWPFPPWPPASASRRPGPPPPSRDPPGPLPRRRAAAAWRVGYRRGSFRHRCPQLHGHPARSPVCAARRPGSQPPPAEPLRRRTRRRLALRRPAGLSGDASSRPRGAEGRPAPAPGEQPVPPQRFLLRHRPRRAGARAPQAADPLPGSAARRSPEFAAIGTVGNQA